MRTHNRSVCYSTRQGVKGLALALICGIAAACAPLAQNRSAPPGAATAQTRGASGATLTAFRSDRELRRYLRRWIKEPSKPRRPGSGSPEEIPETVLITGSLIRGPAVVGTPVTNLSPMDFAQSGALTSPDLFRSITSANMAPSITNKQEAAVDEGDIVKLHRDHLVILRRGRLFTVSVAGGAMQPIDSIDAYPPGVDARDDWYDEMLIAEDRVVVIGYSYRRGGTEINRFRIDNEGRLSFEDAYQLRSNDYYSGRNYASRLIGRRLVFFSPLFLPPTARDPLAVLPAMRRWDGTGREPDFKRFVTSRQVYVPPILSANPDTEIEALHTVTSCDLLARVLDCRATMVLGPDGRSFYVSENAVYIWTTEWRHRLVGYERVPIGSLLYRIPVDGSAPTAIATRGAPVDQFSFREDMSDRTLNVLVRADNAGDAFWASYHSAGEVALLRIPLSLFGNGKREAEEFRYRPLPTPASDEFGFNNRFVGDYVLYGTGNGYGRPESQKASLVAVSVHGGPISELSLPHAVDRIEIMGTDAVVVGSDEHALYFSTVDLTSRAAPALGDRYTYIDASQAETRSHAFFFNPDLTGADEAGGGGPPGGGGTPGVLGLPVARPGRAAYRELFEDSAALVFLRRAHGRFAPLGELAAQDERVVDDHCVASCVDWYGNARPIFLYGRVFALMGYELVEGRLSETAISEVNRVSFAPASMRAGR